MFHVHFGTLRNVTVEYWYNESHGLMGTFADEFGSILNLPLSEVYIK